jgi:hypothetical protein
MNTKKTATKRFKNNFKFSFKLPAADFKDALERAAGSQRVPDLFYYTFAALSLKQPIDSKKISKNVLEGLKLDTSILK